MDRIGIFLYYPGSLKFHPSIVNSAKMWIKNGYKVDVFNPYNPDEGIVSDDNFNVFHVCKYKSNPIMRVISLVIFLMNSYSYMKKRKYKLLIGIDAYGLIIAGCLKSIFKVPLIYHSLEILMPTRFNYISLKKKRLLKKMGYIIHHSIIKIFERYFHKKSLLTIIQDEKRWSVLKRVNKLNYKSPVIYVPNSPMKDKLPNEKSDYLRKKFQISENKKIVLYAGSLGEWIGIDRILNNMTNWPAEVVFVIHGRGNPDFIVKLKKIIDKCPVQVILSLDQFIEDEYNLLVKSADIGIVWYHDFEDPNVYYIGAASGKIFYYLKYGLPVITNGWPGLQEIVEKNSAGICVDREIDIGLAIEKILTNYNFYSDNAKQCFKLYEFSSHYQKVIEELNGQLIN